MSADVMDMDAGVGQSTGPRAVVAAPEPVAPVVEPKAEVKEEKKPE